MPATVALMVILEILFASLVDVTVMPLPDAILTLSPGFTKPTLLPFSSNVHPLVLIAVATFFALASQLSLVPLLTLTVPVSDVLIVA